VSLCLGLVAGHGRFMEPPGRSALWRFPEYDIYKPEAYPIDDQVWCGNVHQFEGQEGQTCGVCGDNAGDGKPREHENGGRFGRGIIVRNYSKGQTIPIHVTSNTQNHGGYVKIQICDRIPETEDCFRDLVLGNGSTRWPLSTADGTLNIQTTAKLPDDLSCNQCTLRFHYRGAQNWGPCDNSSTCDCKPETGNTQGPGCSQQQTFRNCADISVN